MNRLLSNRIFINNLNKFIGTSGFRCNLLLNKTFYNDESDQFGIGSKYAELDSQKSKHKKKLSNRQEDKLNTSSNSEDTFGTISNKLDDPSFKSSITYRRPLPESFDKEDDEFEKKYDKVLNHQRLKRGKEIKPIEYEYYQKIKQLGQEGKIREAINTFFLDMMEKDRIKPTPWIYKVLMISLAKAGYTHMVFELFRRMARDRDCSDIWTTNSVKLPQIISVLFNACANCPYPEYAIKKLNSIRLYLRNRDVKLTTINYAAMISAYGRVGATYEAFNVVDEMIANKVKPDINVFNNLLSACISEPDYGFRYALMVWHMCLSYRIKPDLTTYNLLLKCAKDCRIHIDQSTIDQKQDDTPKLTQQSRPTQNLFPESTDEHKLFVDEDYETLIRENKSEKKKNAEQRAKRGDIYETNHNILENIEKENGQIVEDYHSEIINVNPDQIVVLKDLEVAGNSLMDQIKNLNWWQDIRSNVNKVELMRDISKYKPEIREYILKHNYGSLLTKYNKNIGNEVFPFLALDDDTPYGRLNLVGGIDGVFKAMIRHNVQPDFKTFNTIIQMVPQNLIDSERELLSQIESFKQKPDIDFVNFLIKRRNIRKDFAGAAEAIQLITDHELNPNQATFNCIAYSVNNEKKLNEFLKDFKNTGFQMNLEMLMTLFNKGFKFDEFTYLRTLLRYLIDNRVVVSEKFIDNVNRGLIEKRKKIIEIERSNVHQLNETERESYEDKVRFFETFKGMFEKFSKLLTFEKKKSHPYDKFGKAGDPLYEDIIEKTKTMKA